MTTDNTGRSLDFPRPPRWASAALMLLLRPDDAETVAGDLIEEYRAAGEQWFLPLMLLPFVIVLGSLGGMCGRYFAGRVRA